MKKVRAIAAIVGVSLLGAIPTASAQDVTCENANFSEPVLERFGSIRFSCLDIVEQNGEPHAYLNAEVTRVWAPKLTVRFKRNDDSISNEVTFTPQPDQVFIVDEERRQVGFKDLTETSVLHVYVPVEGPIGKLGFVVDPDTGEVTYFEIDE